jgi:thioredoxin reductase
MTAAPFGVNCIGIIGAGAAGLVATKTLSSCGFQVTTFEKSSFLGGVWKYEPGSAMYDSLRTNLPKEIMVFNKEDSFEECDLSFVGHKEVHRYLENYATKYDLTKYINFNHEILSIDPPQITGDRWKLTVNAGGEVTESFQDAVIVCNGHFNFPYIPTIEAIENFKGIQYHSVNYEAVKYSLSGKKVLVVGAKSSATDMARELAEIGSTVFVSDRNYVAHDLTVSPLEKIFQLPSLLRCDPDGTLWFVNRDHSDIVFPLPFEMDVILWCTGYYYDYPFLDPNLVHGTITRSTDRKKVRNLYQHLFSIDHDARLCFVGLPFSVVPFPLFAIQCEWIAQVYSGKVSLPSKEEQRQWLQQFESNLIQRNQFEDKYHFMGNGIQWDYMRMIAHSIRKEHDGLEFLRVLEEIYLDSTDHRPIYTGAPDSYRNRKYKIDW